MPSLIDIRRRIRSVRNTQQITKALKMVSAAKLRKAQERAIAARPYGTILQQMLANVAEAASQSPEGAGHPLLAVRPENRILLVVITADIGKAGGFNANLIKLAQRCVDEHRSHELSYELIGKKGRDYFRKRSATIRGEHVDIFRTVRFEDAEGIANAIIDRFTKAEIDAVYLFGNTFKSVMAANLTMTRLLPIELPKTPADRGIYIFEQPPDELLGSLLAAILEGPDFLARMLESVAAGAGGAYDGIRDAASSNAADVIDKLTLYMNRVRQASITREIIEQSGQRWLSEGAAPDENRGFVIIDGKQIVGKVIQVAGPAVDIGVPRKGRSPAIGPRFESPARGPDCPRADQYHLRSGAAHRRKPCAHHRSSAYRWAGARHARFEPGRTGDRARWEETLGRVMNVIGEPVDKLGPVNTAKRYPIHRQAPGLR